MINRGPFMLHDGWHVLINGIDYGPWIDRGAALAGYQVELRRHDRKNALPRLAIDLHKLQAISNLLKAAQDFLDCDLTDQQRHIGEYIHRLAATQEEIMLIPTHDRTGVPKDGR
jgi:hypothetical protein